jgi:hypothetical protein
MEFNSINEAESFLREKASGKVLNFNDFINEAKMEQLTNVIFYKEANGDILAYFPNEDYSADGKTKWCYSAKTAHAGCSSEYVKKLKKATPEEYKELKTELENLRGHGQGYNLNVESLVTEAEENGYGQQAFYFAENGDTDNYFFKIKDGQETHALVVSIGKFAKFTQPTEDKSMFGVLGITKLKEDDLDQAVIDNGKFTTNTETITASESLTSKFLEHLALIIEDYLQKNPKVSKFYDELQTTFQAPDYDNKFSVSLAKWPGGNETWHLQEVEKGKTNTISK